MSANSSVIVYVGSFDPFHLGHLEALEKTRELYPDCPTVILPNSPCKSKSARSPLLYRAHLLGLMFPLFTNSDWLNSSQISVDTRPVTTVLKLLAPYQLIGVAGSDVLLRYSDRPPKWTPHRWVIFERTSFPVDPPKTFHGISVDYVPQTNTTHQNSSSTLIRTDRDVALQHLPEALRTEVALHYIFNRSKDSLQTLNRKVSEHRLTSEAFIKTGIDDDFVTTYCKNSALWNSISRNPFLSCSILKVDGRNIHESRIPEHRTLFEVLTEDNVRKFFTLLNQLHEDMWSRQEFVSHGDLSVTNVLVLTDGTLALIDYDKVRVAPLEEMLRDYNQFLASIKFYSLRYGLEYDLDYWRSLGDELYQAQYHFPEEIREKWVLYWNR